MESENKLLGTTELMGLASAEKTNLINDPLKSRYVEDWEIESIKRGFSNTGRFKEKEERKQIKLPKLNLNGAGTQHN